MSDMEGLDVKENDWAAEPGPIGPVAFPRKVSQKTKRPCRVGFEGEAIIWCTTCGSYKRVDEEGYEGVCPDCKRPMLMMRCSRCDHTWWLRNPQVIPTACPRCKTPYWCRTRTRGGRA